MRGNTDVPVHVCSSVPHPCRMLCIGTRDSDCKAQESAEKPHLFKGIPLVSKTDHLQLFSETGAGTSADLGPNCMFGHPEEIRVYLLMC